MVRTIKVLQKEEIELSKDYFEALSQPVIIKGLIDDWPVVQEARNSDVGFAKHLKDFVTRQKAPTLIVDPKSNGQIGYNEKHDGFSFVKKSISIYEVVNRLIDDASRTVQDVGIALQSSLVTSYLPHFLETNSSPDFLAGIEPRLWLGNKTLVPAHYDAYFNLAFVIGGKRTFYLFPPEQIFNLYVGPIDLTPAGPAISLVDILNPDLIRYPKYSLALESMQKAELSPGDAIYIPPMWWHAVHATSAINGLLNYWWGEDSQHSSEKLLASDALLYSILSMRNLPKLQRDAWKTVFDYYVFSNNEHATEHLSDGYGGVLADNTDAQNKVIIDWLLGSLKQHSEKIS